ncbi:MAG: hypothetical protein HQL48_02005 [Gammaproteobacteria bacterium]|nr:hypothetical protein [Gammaproteobacteria bacterium]
MSWLKRLGLGGDEPPPRSLEHPRDLQPGDIIQFDFTAQPQLRNQGFTVREIWTLDTGGDESKRIYFQLEGVEHNFRLRVVNDREIEVAMELLPDELLQLFDEEAIVELLDVESGTQHLLQTLAPPDELGDTFSGWCAALYRQEGYVTAYRYHHDYRHQQIPDEMGRGEVGCDLAWLVSDDRQHLLEFRIFDGGRTEVHLAVILPLRKIAELWPAGKKGESG